MAWTTPGTAVAGAVLEADLWNSDVRDNTQYLKDEVDAISQSVQQLGYQTRTTYSSVTSVTSFASALDFFSTGITFAADGSSAYRVELFLPTYDLSATGRDIFMGLSVGGTETGRFQIFDVNSRSGGGYFGVRYLTPTAGSTTINFRHYCGGAYSTDIRAGNGTGTNYMPAWMAVFGPALT